MNPPQQETSVGLAATFGHPGVARAYRHRPPYPDEVFDVLEGLITERPRTVLDIGAGAELNTVIARHSRSPRYDPDFSLAGALTAAGLFEVAGHASTAPQAFRQRTGDYIEQFHSTASLAREWMPPEEAAAFGREVRAVVAPFAAGDVLEARIVA